MKNILRSLILLVCLLETLSVFAQSPKRLEWIKDIGSDHQYEQVFSTVTTSNGDVVLTTRSWHGETLPTKEIFKIQKYSAGGTFLWERKITGPESEQGILPGGLCVDHDDNVYVLVNSYWEPLILDSLTISRSNHESIIYKFKSDGSLAWFSKLNTLVNGWAAEDNTSLLTVDNNNDLIVTGRALTNDSTFKIDNVPYFKTPMQGAYFLAKYSSDGTVKWARSMITNTEESTANEYFSAGVYVKTDSSNNIFVLGYYGGELKYYELSTITSTAVDLFLSKVSPEGNLTWIRTMGGNHPSYPEWPWGLVLDNDQCPYIVATVGKSIYITGWQDSSYGSVKDEIFICKFNNAGSVLWTDRVNGLNYQRLGSTIDDCPMSINFSKFDNSIIVRSHLFQDAKIKDTTIIIDQENGCPVLWSYDLEGNLKWLHTFPYQFGYLQFNSISATDKGDLYLGGYTGSYHEYHPLPVNVVLSDTSFNTYGHDDGILAKLSLRPTSSVHSLSGVTNLSTVYPNPVITTVNINIPSQFAEKVLTYTVYNVLGQRAAEHQDKASDGVLTFERGNLPSGLYTIRVYDGAALIGENHVVFR